MQVGSRSRYPHRCGVRGGRCEQEGVASSPEPRQWVRRGYYYRSSDSRRVGRVYCRRCKRTFSWASFSRCYGQKRRRLNEPIRKLLVSGVSQRRIALLLGANLKTVVRKFLFLAGEAERRHEAYLTELRAEDVQFTELQFDEMESFERSKCLPLSIPLAVLPGRSKILGFQVCVMPANGLLAKISREKYGPRSDERRQAALDVLALLQPLLAPQCLITTDEKPQYRAWIKKALPTAEHRRVPGQRGAVVGQGELKKIGFDPLFSFNHTAAMLRANINRLFRRTWCTTKKPRRLAQHIALYLDHHNRFLTA